MRRNELEMRMTMEKQETAHIMKYEFWNRIFRCCSACMAVVKEGMDDARINYCWSCGAKFDHSDTDNDTNSEKEE